MKVHESGLEYENRGLKDLDQIGCRRCSVRRLLVRVELSKADFEKLVFLLRIFIFQRYN
jgi:hypothetical protein